MRHLTAPIARTCAAIGAVLALTLATAEAREPVEHKVVKSGLDIVLERYIKPIPPAQLVADALEGLTRLDGQLGVTRDGTSFLVTHKGEHVAQLTGRDGSSWGTAEWADLILDAVRVARDVSAPVAEADADDIKESLMRGALAGLDEHSRYADQSQAKRQRDRREGFVGIGIRFSKSDGVARVVEVFPEGPAARARIGVDDIITHVDGDPVVDMTTQAISTLLRGRPGSRVEVRLRRSDMDVSYLRKLRRARVVPPTIQYRRDGRIVHLTMSGFNRRTGISLVESLERAEAELGPDLAGVVLDLRGNPGGLLDQGVAVVDAFVDDGLISTTEGRHPDALHRFEAGGKDALNGKPLVVLINGRTASSSEMVAAALQDRGRAILLGSSSYGKGSVQSVNDLPDDSELIITWSLIHAPSGYAFHRLGVLPTVCTAGVQSLDSLVTNIRAGALPIRPALSQWRAAEWPRQEDERSALKALCPSTTDAPELDLDAARAILLDHALYNRLLVQSRAVLTAQSE